MECTKMAKESNRKGRDHPPLLNFNNGKIFGPDPDQSERQYVRIPLGKVAKGDGWREMERLLVNKIFALLSDFRCCLGMFKYIGGGTAGKGVWLRFGLHIGLLVGFFAGC
jgi:hypothetical protein